MPTVNFKICGAFLGQVGVCLQSRSCLAGLVGDTKNGTSMCIHQPVFMGEKVILTGKTYSTYIYLRTYHFCSYEALCIKLWTHVKMRSWHMRDLKFLFLCHPLPGSCSVLSLVPHLAPTRRLWLFEAPTNEQANLSCDGDISATY